MQPGRKKMRKRKKKSKTRTLLPLAVCAVVPKYGPDRRLCLIWGIARKLTAQNPAVKIECAEVGETNVRLCPCRQTRALLISRRVS